MGSPNVLAMKDAPSSRMTEREYDREREALRSAYGDSSAEAAGKRDQAVAQLFYRSGWTQEELAKKEGRSRTRVVETLRFGRFLRFVATATNSESLPTNLSERRFRSYWVRTDKDERNERLRFRSIEKLMKEETIVRRQQRPRIGTGVVEQFADGKWHPLETIAKRIDAPIDHVAATLRTIKEFNTFGATCERKKVGTSFHYRIFRKTRTISSDELATKLGPIVEGLKAEGKKNMATMSPGTVARFASLLQQLLDEWRQ